MSAVVTISDQGKLTLSEDIRARMNLHVGDKLEIVSDSFETKIQQSNASVGSAIASSDDWRSLEGILARTPVEVSLPADLDSNPMALRGFLRNSEVDLNASLAAERAWELAREDWLYGSHNEK